MHTIAQTISDIITTRQNDIRPKLNNLWRDSKPLIKLANDLKTLINSSEWPILLNRNPEFKKIWDECVEDDGGVKKHYVTSFIEIVLNSIGTLDKLDNGEDVYSETGSFSALRERTNKDCVEICIMGPVSTGKSSLMQGLTGAPKELLPTGDGKTTAARTTFNNSKDKSAIVHFYTEKEFEAIFNTYIKNFNKVLSEINKSTFPSWNPKTSSLSDFCEDLKKHPSFEYDNFSVNQIPGLDTMISARDYFETFEKFYVTGCPDYYDVLTGKTKSFSYDRIMNGELVPYVSYKKKLSDTKPTSFVALGVKEVIVNWPLQTRMGADGIIDLGKLSLVDTMGIGEAKFLVEEDLREIVKSRADLAIALCKIHNEKDDFEANHPQDKKFLKVISGLKDRQPKDWVYYLANEHAETGITEKVINDFRDAIWEYIGKGKDKFELNKGYWNSLQFMTVSDSDNIEKSLVVNNGGIIEYLINTVLAHLKSDIEEIDKYFIKQATSAYDEACQYRTKIRKLFEELNRISVDISDENTLLETSTQKTMAALVTSTKEVRTKVAKENKSLCEYILNQVYPLLFEPELYRIFNISVPEDNLFLNWNSTSTREQSVSRLRETGFREALIFNILAEFNHYLVAPDKHEASYKEVKSYFEKELNDTDEMKDDISYYSELLKCNFFEELFNQTKDAIKNEFVPAVEDSAAISVGHDEKKKAQFENRVGRELQQFYMIREDILERIMKRLDTTASDTLNKELADFFAKKTKSVLDEFAKSIFDTLVEDSTIQNPGSVSDYIQWLKDFVLKSKNKNLINATESFLHTTIDLNGIVKQMRADDLLENMCNVNLEYTSPKDAAYSFFYCLFVIDRELRCALWKTYTETFDHYGIYAPALNEFMNTVLCVNNISEIKTTEYNAFKSLIRKEKQKSFETSEDGKLSIAKKAFDNCYSELN